MIESVVGALVVVSVIVVMCELRLLLICEKRWKLWLSFEKLL